MSKFTKGPWTTEYSIREKYHLGQIRKADSAHIIVGAGLPLAELHLGNVTANAHLIAAAPEMYEAIEKLMLAIEKCDQYVKIDNNLENAIFLAKECLKKARGE